MQLDKIVLSVQINRILIKCLDKSKFALLKSLQARRKLFNRSEWTIKYESKKKLAELFSALRDHGFMFASGNSGWQPASVFKELKKEGYLKGKGVEIIWKNKKVSTRREI